MPDHSYIMRRSVALAAAIIVARIVLEQAGAPGKVSFIFGVAWLYFLMPVVFALGIRAQNAAKPFAALLKRIMLFALYTRIMVMVTYMLAYAFGWRQDRFIYPQGNVGENVGIWTGLFYIPLRNLILWIAMATILGMAIGSITLLLKRKGPATAAQ